MRERVHCPVVFPTTTQEGGQYANAFRVLAAEEGDVLLDFCSYSMADNEAQVVARIRVGRTFLPFLGERIAEAVVECIAAQHPVVCGNVVLLPDGEQVLLSAETGEVH